MFQNVKADEKGIWRFTLPAILFDLGGTHLRCAVAQICAGASPSTLSFLVKRKIATLNGDSDPSKIWDELIAVICEYVEQITPHVDSSAPIVISFAGPIDSKGQIGAASSIIGRDRKFPNLQADISRLTLHQVSLINDMSAATWYLSTTTAVDRFIAVTISSGIGSKLFDRCSSRKVADHLPYSGEIGHLIVTDDQDAPICDCGIRGHLQAISSGRGIERAARSDALANRSKFERSLASNTFGASIETLSNENHLVPAALAGDEWTLNVIRRCTDPLARLLASVIVATGAERILLIGGLAQSLGQSYATILVDLMRQYYTFPGDPFNNDVVQLCAAGLEASLLGAATYAHVCLGVP